MTKINSRYSLHSNGKITERRHGQFTKATPLDVAICPACDRINPRSDLISEDGFTRKVRVTHCRNCGEKL